MRVVVTGAAGYIGSMLSTMLLNKGYEVIGVDKLLHGGKSILALLQSKNFKLIMQDIENIDTYEKFIDENTIIINLAAVVGEPASRKMPEETQKTNVHSTKKLIDLACKRKVKKFIFVSTCSNYGQVTKNELANETFQLKPLSLYAETKVEVENYLINNVKDNMKWTILRLATVYGLSLRPRFDLTVNDFTLHAIIDKKLVIYLPHSNRPYVHIKDVARGIESILNNQEKTNSQIYNVGNSNENYKKIDIVNEIKNIVKDFDVEFVEKGNDPRDYKVSFEKINKDLGYSTKYRVVDGVKEIEFAITNNIIKDYSNEEYYNA